MLNCYIYKLFKKTKNNSELPDLPPEVLNVRVVEAFSRADRVGSDPRGERVQLLKNVVHNNNILFQWWQSLSAAC